jgi:hypothetical protein
MRHALYKRLRQLEEAGAGALNQLEEREREARSSKLIEKIELFLRERGVEQQGNESVMDALARALEMTSRELRQFLRTGIEPIHQNSTDRGFYERTETREAAGTMPGGA